MTTMTPISDIADQHTARLRALIPITCPVSVTCGPAGGFIATTADARHTHHGGYAATASWIAGYVAAWQAESV